MDEKYYNIHCILTYYKLIIQERFSQCLLRLIQPFADARLLFAAASCRLVWPSFAALLRSIVVRLI